MMLVMVNFLIIFFMWILCFALMFTALFYAHSQKFNDYFTAIVCLFNFGITNVDGEGLFTDKRTKGWGNLLVVVYITFTAIFLLSIIVALLNNLFKQVIAKIDADHNANLVTVYSKMKNDKKYGLLVFS